MSEQTNTDPKLILTNETNDAIEIVDVELDEELYEINDPIEIVPFNVVLDEIYREALDNDDSYSTSKTEALETETDRPETEDSDSDSSEASVCAG